MTLLKLILLLPFAIATTLALVGSFVLTLHRRRDRAFGRSKARTSTLMSWQRAHRLAVRRATS
jgi:hypothetical protein